MSLKSGSFVIQSFYRKYVNNLRRNKEMFLYEIFDSIQHDLQKQGQQLPEAVWNDGTRFLMFKPNKKIKVAEAKEENEDSDEEKHDEPGPQAKSATTGGTTNELMMVEMQGTDVQNDDGGVYT